MLAKLAAMHGQPIDGHAPGVTGKQLNAYAAAGIGSDHETVAPEEAREKLARGMYLLVREATNARNLDALVRLIKPQNAHRICLCTDDRTPPDLLGDGSIDMMLRRVIAAGVDPVIAFRLCTLNPSEWFGLHDRGAIAPGRVADLMVFDDLVSPTAREVFVAGRRVAEGGRLRPRILPEPVEVPSSISASCNPRFDATSLRIPARTNRVRVIGSIADQLVTENRVLDARVSDGHAEADVSRDLLKIAVLDRHTDSRNIGLAFIQGIGLKRGAIAGTVAHDHHNLVVIGADDSSMLAAARAVVAMRGGLVAVSGDNVLASLALPVAGLMSDRPVEAVRDAHVKLLAAARVELGSPLHDPFMAMSFMALEVIPKLKLTDQGLVDVDAFAKVELFV
jgi:adenine deaminase